MKNDEPIDMSPLDPESDPERLERVVANVLERLGPGLVPDAQSSLERQVVHLLASSFRPLFIAASLVAVISAATLARRLPSEGEAARVGPTPNQVDPWQAWLATEAPPRAEDLLFMFAGDNR